MNTDKIDDYIARGLHDRHWYRDTEALFTELFGADRLGIVTKLFAATSINTSLKANVTLMRKALHEFENGLPLQVFNMFDNLAA